jgi:hypothetical protein
VKSTIPKREIPAFGAKYLFVVSAPKKIIRMLNISFF